MESIAIGYLGIEDETIFGNYKNKKTHIFPTFIYSVCTGYSEIHLMYLYSHQQLFEEYLKCTIEKVDVSTDTDHIYHGSMLAVGVGGTAGKNYGIHSLFPFIPFYWLGAP